MLASCSNNTTLDDIMLPPNYRRWDGLGCGRREHPQTLLPASGDGRVSAARFLGRGLKRFSLQFSVFLEKNFYFALCFLQLFAAGSRELHAFLEQFQRLFKWYIPFFKFLDNLLQSLEALLKLCQKGRTPLSILLQLEVIFDTSVPAKLIGCGRGPAAERLKHIDCR